MENFNKILPHQVPQGYFEKLTDHVMSSVRASMNTEDENGLEKTHDTHIQAFEVDKTYFDTLSDRIISSIHASEESEKYIIQSAGKDNVFNLDNNYFESLSERISHRISVSDENLVDMDEELNLDSQDTPYEVPAGYFDQFTVNISEKNSTKIIDFSQAEDTPKAKSSIQRKFFKSMRWSNAIAATVVFIILGWGAVILLQNDDVVTQQSSSNLTAQSVNVQNYDVESKSVQLALAELEDVSQDALMDYLDSNIESEDIYMLMDFYAKSNRTDFHNPHHNILNDVSSEDIQSYLEYEGML